MSKVGGVNEIGYNSLKVRFWTTYNTVELQWWRFAALRVLLVVKCYYRYPCTGLRYVKQNFNGMQIKMYFRDGSGRSSCSSTITVYLLYNFNVKFYIVNGSVKEPNISIYFFFSTHHSMVFYFRCSVYWWKGSVRF